MQAFLKIRIQYKIHKEDKWAASALRRGQISLFKYDNATGCREPPLHY